MGGFVRVLSNVRCRNAQDGNALAGKPTVSPLITLRMISSGMYQTIDLDS